MKYFLIGTTVTLLLAACGKADSTNLPTEDGPNTQFVWDFSEPRKFTYDFLQTSSQKQKMGNDGEGMAGDSRLEGHLTVKVKPDQTADLALGDLVMTSQMHFKGDTARPATKNNPPAMVVQGMRPDGSFDNPSTEILFGILMALPTRDLAIGESDKAPLQMPFNAMGSQLMVNGYNQLKFVRHDTLLDHKCAVLEGDINVSELPEEMEGEYAFAAVGKGIYYFDLVEHCFVGADVQLALRMKAAPKNMKRFGIEMDMISQNEYKIRLREAAD